MNIQKFHLAAEAGEKYDWKEVSDYIKSFEHVVLWGAAALGEEVGEFLLNNGVDFDEYWDLKAESMGPMHGKDIILPFSKEYDRNRTLVILGISNNVIHMNLLNQLRNEKFHNVLRGTDLYMAFMCPSDVESGLDIKHCLRKSPCLKIFCPRLVNVFNHDYTDGDKAYQICKNSATVIVNQKCNLSCKFCTSYMHSYKPDERINFKTEDIIRDIDNFLSSIDSIGSFTVMGGEPFLHPDLSQIIKAMLKHENFAFLSIATNGVSLIKPEQLDGLQDPRVVVSFNDYLPALPIGMRKVFEKNIQTVTQANVFYTVGKYMSEWTIPSTLYDVGASLEEKIDHKELCDDLLKYFRCHQLKNGKLHPCDFANSVYSLGVADYPADYVDLTDRRDLRKRLHEHYNAQFYHVCGHCKRVYKSTKGAAVQGKADFINPPEGVDPRKYLPE
jgi:MoaA/NifB/PqqE/SkfB family radical SAM enzyme